MALKRKNQLNASWLVPNWVRRVQVGSKTRLKIVQYLNSKLECLLASTFHRFWWILGAKLGSKIEPKSIKNGKKSIKPGRPSQSGQVSQVRSSSQGSGPFPPHLPWTRVGFPPLIRMCPPRGLGPLVPRGVRISNCDFLAILLPFFFSSFFRCHF